MRDFFPGDAFHQRIHLRSRFKLILFCAYAIVLFHSGSTSSIPSVHTGRFSAAFATSCRTFTNSLICLPESVFLISPLDFLNKVGVFIPIVMRKTIPLYFRNYRWITKSCHQSRQSRLGWCMRYGRRRKKCSFLTGAKPQNRR